MQTPRYVFFPGVNDYWRLTNHDLYENSDVYVCDGIKNRLLNKLDRIHNSWPLNKHVEMPFKSIWFPLYADKKKLDVNKKQWAVFAESNPIAYNGQYLKILRNQYPLMVFVYVFSNPCSEYNLTRLARVQQYYDHVITFSVRDAERYGFEMADVHGYSHNELPPRPDLKESDLFFVGADKGRLPLLLSIQKRMTALGLTCDFYIVDVKQEDQQPREGVVYNQRLPYTDVLQHVGKTKCVLEILEGDFDYSSIRLSEALVYRKKLITKSQTVLKHPYYSPKQMLCFRDVEEITREFFEVPIVEDYDIEVFSPNRKLIGFEKMERRTK